ncbi:dihydroorotase [Flammeovirga kamogawensis]|uniref:Dihydroorotase n=1 Tax=Flammeovirga kamogawensis TaxID=373891 RepID=A0ABX8GX63_9BACT|nr:dihydroorotase [Flammeovirga kamogawensis]MBB6460773.1 dihydroorotase [Flammeovirga kamogawensis]QWG08126.1 dihydroorotase [Flammeovirga kamogawensis]TRX69929.1 dihydroorotase [Flammeovirga kamogawensis]
MTKLLIKNAQIVNEGKVFKGDVRVVDGKIDSVSASITAQDEQVIDAEGKYLLPGLIDDQVHFREPGLTEKANIETEARAAVSGGITSFMEMPNTKPPTVTIEALEDKYAIAKRTSLANYSFYIGATNDNLAEVLKADPKNVCGIKVFMGSSTGNMLVDNEATLGNLFAKAQMIIASHCEDDPMIAENLEKYKEKYGEDIPMECHPEIRSAEACYSSSSKAVALAKKHGARLHILHISTAKELELFQNDIPLKDKKITSEACVHHMWFSDEDYKEKGTHIKWNPAVKTKEDGASILAGVLNDKIDVIATDHAPHTLQEKSNTYLTAPSGGPLVQHSLQVLLDFYKQGKISLEKIVEKACHNPAILFEVEDRGYIKEGYWADLVLVDLEAPQKVEKSNLNYKCGWSPFEGHTFSSTITHTIVSGHLAYENGKFNEDVKGKRLTFNR